MAPECVSKLEVGEATDVWAYGAVLLVAATWLVLGQKGMLEFEMFRTLSLSKLRFLHSLLTPLLVFLWPTTLFMMEPSSWTALMIGLVIFRSTYAFLTTLLGA